MSAQGTPGPLNSVVIEIPVSPEFSTFCYNITASNGSFTVLVQRTMTGEQSK